MPKPKPRRRTTAAKVKAIIWSKDQRAARAIGKRVAALCQTNRHTLIHDLEARFADFRELRSRVRGEDGYAGPRERPLWRAFLAGIAGR